MFPECMVTHPRVESLLCFSGFGIQGPVELHVEVYQAWAQCCEQCDGLRDNSVNEQLEPEKGRGRRGNASQQALYRFQSEHLPGDNQV